MATISAPTRVISGVPGTRVEEYRMDSILVRDLDQKTIERLKEHARLNRRSLQQEAKALLKRAAKTLTMREARRLSDRWRRHRGARAFSDSTRLIRDDRDSR
jgi:plasmid stability protein